MRETRTASAPEGFVRAAGVHKLFDLVSHGLKRVRIMTAGHEAFGVSNGMGCRPRRR
jgi:hypothetical protein